jgi:hypothetical protein
LLPKHGRLVSQIVRPIHAARSVEKTSITLTENSAIANKSVAAMSAFGGCSGLPLGAPNVCK